MPTRLDEIEKQLLEVKLFMSEGDDVTLPLRVISERINSIGEQVNKNSIILDQIQKERNKLVYMLITLMITVIGKAILQYLN